MLLGLTVDVYVSSLELQAVNASIRPAIPTDVTQAGKLRRSLLYVPSNHIHSNSIAVRENSISIVSAPKHVPTFPTAPLVSNQEAKRPFSRLNRAKTTMLLVAREQRSRREVEKAQNASLEDRGINQGILQDLRGLSVGTFCNTIRWL